MASPVDLPEKHLLPRLTFPSYSELAPFSPPLSRIIHAHTAGPHVQQLLFCSSPSDTHQKRIVYGRNYVGAPSERHITPKTIRRQPIVFSFAAIEPVESNLKLKRFGNVTTSSFLRYFLVDRFVVFHVRNFHDLRSIILISK